MIKDTIVKSVLDKYKQRSEVGIKKYNKTINHIRFTHWEKPRWHFVPKHSVFPVIVSVSRIKVFGRVYA